MRIAFAGNVRRFLTRYYQLIPDWMGRLGENSYRLAFYLFYRARKAPIDEGGAFRVKIEDIIHYIGLPAKEEVRNRNCHEAILRPFTKAVEEIETISGGSLRMEFDCGTVNAFLAGRMNVGIDATVQGYLQKLEKARTEKQANAEKSVRKSRRQPSSSDPNPCRTDLTPCKGDAASCGTPMTVPCPFPAF